MNELKTNIEIASISEITVLLRRFGLYRRYKGCRRLAYAVCLVLEDENRLEAVVKEVYIPVAERFGCSWSAVEKSLRVAGIQAWFNNYDDLCEIAGMKLRTPPVPAELLDIFAMYIKQRYMISGYYKIDADSTDYLFNK